MFKVCILAGAMALATMPMAWAQQGHGGSSATATSKTSANLYSDVAVGVVTGGPIGGVAAAASSSSNGLGTIANPQFVLGGTAGAPSMSTFNDCAVAWSGGLGPITGGQTKESERCVKQRLAQMAIREMKDPGMALELLCGIDYWNDADKTSGRNQCPAQRAALASSVAKPAPVVQAVPVSQGCPVHEVNGQRFVSCP